MDQKEACSKWIHEFSLISTSLIIKAFKDDPDELEILSSEYPVYAWPCAHGWMFHPEYESDEEWIREHVEDVESCGFLVYDSEETGILLGVDGGGYSFMDEHWLPLYAARGLQWHDTPCIVN